MPSSRFNDLDPSPRQHYVAASISPDPSDLFSSAQRGRSPIRDDSEFFSREPSRRSGSSVDQERESTDYDYFTSAQRGRAPIQDTSLEGVDEASRQPSANYADQDADSADYKYFTSAQRGRAPIEDVRGTMGQAGSQHSYESSRLRTLSSRIVLSQRTDASTSQPESSSQLNSSRSRAPSHFGMPEVPPTVSGQHRFRSVSSQRSFVPVYDGFDLGGGLAHSDGHRSVHDDTEASDHFNSQRSLPILASDSQRSGKYVWDAETGLGTATCTGGRIWDADTGIVTAQCGTIPLGDLEHEQSESPLQKFTRRLTDIRWKLSRNVFSVPLPIITPHSGLKVGDFVLTLPIIVIILGYTVALVLRREISASGVPPTIGLALVFTLTVRNNSVLLALTGLTFERVLRYHKIAAVVTTILSGLHGVSYLLARSNGEIDRNRPMEITGVIPFTAMVALVVLSVGYIRRRFFEFFVRAHWLLFLVVIVYAVIHGATLALLGVAPWVLDMVFRLAYRPRVYAKGSFSKGQTVGEGEETISRGVLARHQITVSKVSGDVTHLQFPRVRADTGERFDYKAGQYAFVCIPSISMLEWHPFTISSSPEEDMVTFHIKALGDWTSKLLEIASIEGIEGKSPFDMLVDGPYGGISIDIYNRKSYSHFVLLSGGIGVTPMRSVTTWLHNECYKRKRNEIQRVRFVWAVNNRESLKTLLTDDSSEQMPQSMRNFFPAANPTSPLQKPRSPSFSDAATEKFSFDFYVTQTTPNVEAQVYQELRKWLRYGARPDINKILRDMGNEARQSGKSRVAVLVCGPKLMVQETVSACIKLSGEMNLYFDVHSERFGL